MTLRQIRAALKKSARPADRAALMRYFKTGKGEYGEGDIFLGVKMPAIRRLTKAGSGLTLDELRGLVRSKVHEERMLGLLSLVRKFERAAARQPDLQKKIYALYMAERSHINNWDLIDLSAPHIAGGWLYGRPRGVLRKLAKSKSIWDRRISILSCFYFIKQDDFSTAFEIAHTVLNDPHDLIHKAAGWMLREIGNRDRSQETAFLRKYAASMPRTMLRYAIEKFPEKERLEFLNQDRTGHQSRLSSL